MDTEVVSFDLDANVKTVGDSKWSSRGSARAFKANPRLAGKSRKAIVKKQRKRLPEHVEIPETVLKAEDVDDVEELEPERAKTKLHVKKISKKKERFRERIERKIRAKILAEEDEGELAVEEGKETYLVSQKDIVDNADIATATKHFNLDLDHGPYRFNISRNGRHLLLGGRNGHIAALDWLTKKLHTEVMVTERVNAVKWLHSDNMFAAAQKRWTYIYDKNGVELHCIKSLFNVHSLEFLPRHFLLAAMSNEDMLSYLDISTGEMVQQWRIKQKNTTCLTQNDANAILVSGNAKGVVCMWSPNNREALVEMLAHKAPLSGVAVDRTGSYMATVGLDKQLKVWDLRTYRELGVYRLPFPPTEIAFSQMNNIAVACGTNVHVYRDMHIGTTTRPFLQYNAPSTVSHLQFCPYEDVLGVGHAHGYASIVVPSSGDPNFDALRGENPYESKKQRREREVRQLLEKLQPTMISLNPEDINKVNRTELRKNMDYRDTVMHWKDAKSMNVDPSRYHSRKKTLK